MAITKLPILEAHKRWKFCTFYIDVRSEQNKLYIFCRILLFRQNKNF